MAKNNGASPGITSRQVTDEMLERVKKTVEFTKAAISRYADGADGIMVSYHIVKGSRVHHYFEATDFPIGDWGRAMVAMGFEAKQAEMRAMTGRAKG